MKQDLRELFKKDRELQRQALRDGHKERFAALLEEELPQGRTTNRFLFLKLAASLIILLGIGWLFYPSSEPDQIQHLVESPRDLEQEKGPDKVFELQEIAPEFEKIENFYLASLNLELANLEVNDRSLGIIDSFMDQLAGLDKEYQRLNEELFEYGANNQTLEAMINNLQFRLELLRHVKSRMEIDKKKMKESYENIQI